MFESFAALGLTSHRNLFMRYLLRFTLLAAPALIYLTFVIICSLRPIAPESPASRIELSRVQP